MSTFAVGGKTFEVRRDPIDVTSMSRPDERWQHIDTHGHVHQWEWPDGRRVYQPAQQATLPTLEWLKTGVGYFEDGEEYAIGEYRCTQCGDIVQPGKRADDCTRYAPGLTYYYIDGESVDRETFERGARAAGLKIETNWPRPSGSPSCASVHGGSACTGSQQ